MQDKRQQRMIFYRPVFFAAIYLMLGILSGYYAGRLELYAVLFGCAGLGLTVFDWLKNRSLPAVILFILMFGIGTGLMTLEQTRVRIPTGAVEITGRVVDIAHYEYSSYYTLADWQAKDDDITISSDKRLRLKTETDTLKFGDIVSFSGEIDYPDEQRNQYGFNERLYLLSRGISYTAEAERVMVTDNRKGMDSYFFRVRQYVTDNIDMHFSEETRGIAKGLIIGDKADISESVYNAYRTGGAASILAVSGLHFGFISLFFFWLLRLIGIGRKPANLIVGIMMLFYAGVVGFTVSAVRALIMGWLVIAAGLLADEKIISHFCVPHMLYH